MRSEEFAYDIIILLVDFHPIDNHQNIKELLFVKDLPEKVGEDIDEIPKSRAYNFVYRLLYYLIPIVLEHLESL